MVKLILSIILLKIVILITDHDCCHEKNFFVFYQKYCTFTYKHKSGELQLIHMLYFTHLLIQFPEL